FPQQPATDIRQLLHDATRPWRYRHGPCDRSRCSGGPWRNNPARRFRSGYGVRTENPGVGGRPIVMKAAEPGDRSSRGRAQFIARAGFCLAIIASGLTFRRFGFGIGLPAAIVKYGGSILWGAMVYLLVALATPRSWWPRIASI